MALLHDLVLLLNADQLASVATLALPVRERQVLDFTLQQKKTVFPTALALKKLDMTQTHFEKVCSVVLRKLLSHFAGPDPLAQFNFIVYLPGRSVKLLRHQMKITEKHIKDEPTLHCFYESCFEIVIGHPVSEIDKREIAYYTTRVLETVDITKHPEKITEIKSKHFFAIVNQAGGSMETELPHVRKKLETKINRLIQEATTHGSERGIFHAYNAAAYFYTVTEQFEKALSTYKKLLGLIRKQPKLFSESEALDVRLKHAEILGYLNKFDESYNEFKLILAHASYDTPHIKLAYHARFLKIALTTGHYDMAKRVLDNTFAEALKKTMLSHRIMGHLQYISYYLHTNELTEASKHIQKARSEMDKKKLLNYEIQLRVLETACVFLKGDLYGAKSLADKNLKFLRSKNFNFSNSDFPLFYLAVSGIYHKLLSGKKFSLKQQQAYDYHFRASWSHIGPILQRMNEMNNTNKGAIRNTLTEQVSANA
jgi:tetratricopeptide (TPR) repeat protein